jgi:hypothetical protein
MSTTVAPAAAPAAQPPHPQAVLRCLKTAARGAGSTPGGGTVTPNPAAPWNAFTTIAEFNAWKNTEDPQAYLTWANLGLKSDGNGNLDPATTVQAAKDAINASPSRYFFDPTNKSPDAAAFTPVTATQAKDPAATATDRKAVTTVTFPADKAVGTWVLFVTDPADTATPADAAQAKQIAAGQTSMTFNVTYGKDRPGGAAVYFGKGYDKATATYTVNKALAAPTFP